tara:strand:- start:215 stop:445 length:231 start_codon:yes stop_codon:yes gene_type:complete
MFVSSFKGHMIVDVDLTNAVLIVSSLDLEASEILEAMQDREAKRLPWQREPRPSTCTGERQNEHDLVSACLPSAPP